MHVQDEPGQVAYDKDGDDEHQDDRHVVVLPAPAPHPPSETRIVKFSGESYIFVQT